MTKSFYFPAPLSHLGELPIDRLLVFQGSIPAAGDALLRAHDAQSKFGATQGHDGDTVTLGLSFDGSVGLFRRPVASRKKMRIKGGVTTKHLRRNASTRYQCVGEKLPHYRGRPLGLSWPVGLSEKAVGRRAH